VGPSLGPKIILNYISESMCKPSYGYIDPAALSPRRLVWPRKAGNFNPRALGQSAQAEQYYHLVQYQESEILCSSQESVVLGS